MELRKDLEALPARMQRLPIDERGYPVPWFVAWVDVHSENCDTFGPGPDLSASTKPCNCAKTRKPEFRAADAEKFRRAIKEKLCWVCGEKMVLMVSFVAGPMCGINRTSAESPSHIECGRYSARNCPFLANPQQVRREDDKLNNEDLRENSSGFALTRNPGVAMLWITRTFEIFEDHRGMALIQMGSPSGVEWYARGRTATRDEVLESIDSGMPSLEAIARTEPGGLEVLHRYRQRFEKWIPKN